MPIDGTSQSAQYTNAVCSLANLYAPYKVSFQGPLGGIPKAATEEA